MKALHGNLSAAPSSRNQIVREAQHDEDEEYQARRRQREAQDLGADGHGPRRCLHQILLDLSARDQAIVLDGVLAPIFFQRHRSDKITLLYFFNRWVEKMSSYLPTYMARFIH